MISVIICSANKNLLNNITENIKATINATHEIIAIENSNAALGICTVYNKGITLAKYDILCFIHEDVFIKTPDWGPTLIAIFKNNERLGLLGVAGTSYKPLSPSGWGHTDFGTLYANIIQSFKRSAKQPEHIYFNPNKETLSTVACIDGVLMCTTKKVVKEFSFDNVTFTGFHGYDLDFSLTVGQKYQVAVTFEILIDHFSEGNYDSTWMMENLKLHNKWLKHLPKNVSSVTGKQALKIEKDTFRDFIDQLIKFNYPITIALKTLWDNGRFLRMNMPLFLQLKYSIVKKYIKTPKFK